MLELGTCVVESLAKTHLCSFLLVIATPCHLDVIQAGTLRHNRLHIDIPGIDGWCSKLQLVLNSRCLVRVLDRVGRYKSSVHVEWINLGILLVTLHDLDAFSYHHIRGHRWFWDELGLLDLFSDGLKLA